MSSGSRSTDESLAAAMGLDDVRRARRLALFELGAPDAAALAAVGPALEAALDGVVADFYAHLLRFPELESLLAAEPGRIERLKGLQRAYIRELAAGRFDAAYFESRLRVGQAHHRIGLHPEWYVGAFSHLLRLVLRAVVGERAATHVLGPVEAMIKTVFLDVSLAIDTYIHGGFVERRIATDLERAARVAEQALAARAEVERLKDDLTSMIVHDLKNPVNGIVMMVQLAQRKGRDLPAQHRGYLQNIERTCHEMLRLIQNLLEISKIEEGKMPVSQEAVVLAEVVDDVLGEFRPIAEEGGRVLAVGVDTALPPALCDRVLLRRVLVNLIVNALRHSGSTEIRVAADAAADGATVTLRVVDHGRGIPAAEQAHVFEKFRSARRSPADAPNADTGLGLPFCRLAVERMGGTIALCSMPDATTEFAVTLPTAPRR